MGRNDLIYLARPIDFGHGDTQLIDFTINKLNALGFPVYNPLGAFEVNGVKPNAAINRVNEYAMIAATGAVAFLPSWVHSVGVPAEISYLLSINVPTIVVTDLTDTSWVVAGWAEHHVAEVVTMDQGGVAEGVVKLLNMMEKPAPRSVDEPNRIVFERRHPDAILPTKGYEDDAGYDLYAAEAVTVPARGQAVVPCGISVDVPSGMWAQVTGRSSTLRDFNLMVAPTVGVIDEGYTGELFAPVVSNSDVDVKVDKGQRLAQLILHDAPGQIYSPMWGTVRPKDRGENGFGSTGR